MGQGEMRESGRGQVGGIAGERARQEGILSSILGLTAQGQSQNLIAPLQGYFHYYTTFITGQQKVPISIYLIASTDLLPLVACI